MRVLGGACFILKPRMILVAKLDLTAPPTSVSFGVCLSTVSANQKFSLCSGKHPFLQPRRGLEGRTPHLWFSLWESCCVLSPPGLDLYRNKVSLLYFCLPFSLGALEPQTCMVYQLFSLLIVKENQNIKTYALRNRRNEIVFRPPSPCLWAAVTKYHKLGDLNNGGLFLAVLEAGMSSSHRGGIFAA